MPDLSTESTTLANPILNPILPANDGEVANCHRAVDRAYALRAALIARSREDDRASMARLAALPDAVDPEDDALHEALCANYNAALEAAWRIEEALKWLCNVVRYAEKELAS